jgi:hypothetical protein
VGFSIATFCSTFCGLLVLSAFGLNFIERMLVLVSVVLIFGIVMFVLRMSRQQQVEEP